MPKFSTVATDQQREIIVRIPFTEIICDGRIITVIHN